MRNILLAFFLITDSSLSLHHRKKTNKMEKEGGGKAGHGGEEAVRVKKGLSVTTTALFLMAQVASAGFLSLPKAFANTGNALVNFVIYIRCIILSKVFRYFLGIQREMCVCLYTPIELGGGYNTARETIQHHS